MLLMIGVFSLWQFIIPVYNLNHHSQTLSYCGVLQSYGGKYSCSVIYVVIIHLMIGYLTTNLCPDICMMLSYNKHDIKFNAQQLCFITHFGNINNLYGNHNNSEIGIPYKQVIRYDHLLISWLMQFHVLL